MTMLSTKAINHHLQRFKGIRTGRRSKGIRKIIIKIFQEYVSSEVGHGHKNDHRTGTRQRGNSPSQELAKYFYHTYPFYLKDKIKGANSPRKFCLVTNTIFMNNVKRLASINAMAINEFIVQILTERMVEELENDPMLFLKYIPDS